MLPEIIPETVLDSYFGVCHTLGHTNRWRVKMKYAVLKFTAPVCEDDVMIPRCVGRFATFEEAEKFRVHRFGKNDEFSSVVED
jgi:hypothetical protein